ncbi:hypothetical protein [Cellulophaga sp. BC115SP]|uniref:hypothetical protein n=1 Tax=Cellulophaga sp. BC115SP TaxID=2683263 RepID=UPI001412DD0C|nr:hypothetical protein [Cellulophaga sp. BC115SP]NBB29935.1 hypothetical protein [Cellulophaga sp. BC115SP]
MSNLSQRILKIQIVKKMKPLQKQISKDISQVGVKKEHAFARVKRVRIVKEKICLRSDQILDCLMDIAVGLHNHRVTFE